MDTREFSRAVRALQAARRVSFQRLLRDQARLFVRDVLKLTPPRGRAAISESFNAQKRRGEKRVERDILKVFMPVSALKILSEPQNASLAESLGSAIRRQDWAVAEAILVRLGFSSIRVEPDATEHDQARDRRGQVNRRQRPTIILHVASVKKYIKAQLAHVGKTKAGWLLAANALGVPVPQWIRRHGGATPGLFRDETPNSSNPSITIGNLVIYGDGFQDLRIVQTALQLRTKAMKTQTEKILQAEIRKAGG